MQPPCLQRASLSARLSSAAGESSCLGGAGSRGRLQAQEELVPWGRLRGQQPVPCTALPSSTACLRRCLPGQRNNAGSQPQYPQSIRNTLV